MTTFSVLISVAILGLFGAGAMLLVPVLQQREIAVVVAEIQAAAAAYRDAEVVAASPGSCLPLPTTAVSLKDIGIANLSGGARRAAWSVRFVNGRGIIDATTSDHRLGHMIARAGGGVRSGNITSIPALRPAAIDRASPEAHNLRQYFVGAELC